MSEVLTSEIFGLEWIKIVYANTHCSERCNLKLPVLNAKSITENPLPHVPVIIPVCSFVAEGLWAHWGTRDEYNCLTTPYRYALIVIYIAKKCKLFYGVHLNQKCVSIPWRGHLGGVKPRIALILILRLSHCWCQTCPISKDIPSKSLTQIFCLLKDS